MLSKRIPQLNEINNYLHNKTGFTIKPTHGILSHR
jgi:phenylalanine-4-hydroxylase